MMPERKRDINFKRTKRSMVTAKYRVKLRERKRANDLILLSRLNEIKKLAIANSVLSYGHM